MRTKKRFKKIYLEITNACNLSCPFCIQNQRPIRYLTINNMKVILNKLEPYTDYLYFHILGEPLMHPNINELIKIASQKFNIQITTNGYLIDKIKNNANIRQINISLHSFDSKYKVSLEQYMNNILKAIDNLLKNNTYISLRIWINNKYQDQMIEMINQHYKCKIDLTKKNYKINKYLYIQQFKEFIWPNLDNDYNEDRGTCYAIKDHIGILVDGTIVPCCLDAKGIINLGNIYDHNISEILTNKRVQEMLIGFQQKKKKETLCKHCSFLNK